MGFPGLATAAPLQNREGKVPVDSDRKNKSQQEREHGSEQVRQNAAVNADLKLPEEPYDRQVKKKPLVTDNSNKAQWRPRKQA